jgi:hypothetical protein
VVIAGKPTKATEDQPVLIHRDDLVVW